MSDLSVLDGTLKCLKCSGPIQVTESLAECSSCGTEVQIREGVLVMTAQASEEIAANAGEDTKTREAYESRYQDLQNATRYNKSYKQRMSKRWSTIREFSLLKRLLSSQPASRVLLDLPCGGGRLSPALVPFTDTLVEADVALGQVLHAKKHALAGAGQIWMTASALKIPLLDNSVDGVVSCRLSHHLPEAEDRDQLVRELLRVSSRFVIMTYFDYSSIKNIIRRIRRPFNKKLPKMTMRHSRLRELAAEQNARLVSAPWLAFFSSGHRYAMMVKDQA